MAGAAAALIVRARWPILAFWILATIYLAIALPTIREAQVGALGDLVPHDAEAIKAEQRSHDLFRFPLLSRTLVVQRDRGGMGIGEQARVARRALDLNLHRYPGLRRIAGALPVTNTLGQPPFSRERSTTGITYLFFQPTVGPDERQRLAERLIEKRIRPQEGGAFAGVTGAVAARSQQADLISDHLPVVEIATVLLVALVVGIHFQALGAPLVTLLAVGISYLTSIRLIAWIGQQVGISVPSEIEPVIVVLLFGVVTDYSIFFLSRVRGRIAAGEDPRSAVTTGTGELLPIIAVAGITVVAASGSLALARLGFFQAFGPGVAMAVLIGLLVAITLVPAALAIGGRALFWPRRPGIEMASERAAEDGARSGKHDPQPSRVLALATARPALTAMVCVAFLLAAASGLLKLDLGNPLIRGLPRDASANAAYRQARQGFAPGILSPSVVIVEGRGITAKRRELANLQGLIAARRGVAQVVGPADQPVRRDFGGVLSPTGSAARYFVVFGSDPLGARAVRRLDRLREQLPRLLAESGLPPARPLIAGDTALVAETIDKSVDDLWRVGPAAIALVFLILALFLRAVLAPIYLIAASALALTAALGLAAYVFQGLADHGEVTYFVPFAAAALLVSLGSDYNVFLAGRIWDEARQRPLREAVSVAGARAARPITTAGLVLAGSFALLALVPIRAFQELAFTMAAGLIIDAFLVRTLLVPALIVLVGDRGGWPGGRLRAKRRVVPGAARSALPGE